jgi:tetratricopeptide (TPR) repeat protein
MEIDPSLGLAYFHGGVSYFLKGLSDEAEETFEKGKKLFAPPGWMEAMQGLICVRKGEREKAAWLLEGAIEAKKTVKNVSSPSLAWLAGELGNLDLAFEFLDKAYEERDILLCFVHIYTKVLSPAMAADQRFKALLARMKLDF